MRFSPISLSGLFHKIPKWTRTRKENTKKHNMFMRQIEDLYNAGKQQYEEAKQAALAEMKQRPKYRITADGLKKM